MIHIDNYCEQAGISRSTADRYIAAGELKAIKHKGLTYVIPNNLKRKAKGLDPRQEDALRICFASGDDNNAGKSTKTKVREIIAEKKHKFDKAILSAKKRIAHFPGDATAIRTKLVSEIENELEVLGKAGINVSGYNSKSIYRKLKKEDLSRKTRADRFTIKNEILARPEVRHKIYESAVCIYMECATSNFSLLSDLILERAKREEELYEVAAIPRSTLYYFLKSDFESSGYTTLHKYLNHFNLFKKTLPKVSGAFTDDIEFFDYIIGDDHKLDVSAVLVWDEASRKWVHKQVKIWFWIEAKTMFPLGWEIKVGDFTVNDLKESLTRAFLQWGLPKKAVVVDNGIGRGAEFKNFLLRAGLGTEQLQFSAAYDPTNKAPGERSFGFVKNEFDVFFNNFVGPNKEAEARHFSEKLSPEETLETLSSYKSKLEDYLTGFYIERIRSRRMHGKVKKISIKNFFDVEWQTWNKIDCDKHKLRYAFGKEKDVKYNGEITISGEKYQTVEPMPLGWYGRKFRVLYNTADMSEIDLYTIDDMLDGEGNMVQKGSYVRTLYCVRTHPQKNELIRSLKKSILKSTKKLAEDIISLKDNNLIETQKFMPYSVANNGELSDELKTVKKQVELELQTVAQSIEIESKNLKEDIPHELQELTQMLDCNEDEDQGYSLTMEDDE